MRAQPHLPLLDYLPHATETQTMTQQPAHNSLTASQSLNTKQPWLLRHGGLLKGRKSATGEAEEQQQNSFSPLCDSINGVTHIDELLRPTSSFAAQQDQPQARSSAAPAADVRHTEIQAYTEDLRESMPSGLTPHGQDSQVQDRVAQSQRQSRPFSADRWDAVKPHKVSTSQHFIPSSALQGIAFTNHKHYLGTV